VGKATELCEAVPGGFCRQGPAASGSSRQAAEGRRCCLGLSEPRRLPGPRRALGLEKASGSFSHPAPASRLHRGCGYPGGKAESPRVAGGRPADPFRCAWSHAGAGSHPSQQHTLQQVPGKELRSLMAGLNFFCFFFKTACS